MGRSYMEVKRSTGIHILPAPRDRATINIPEPVFIVTLDADSLISHDYALRLIYIMLQRGNERMAVCQVNYKTQHDN